MSQDQKQKIRDTAVHDERKTFCRSILGFFDMMNHMDFDIFLIITEAFLQRSFVFFLLLLLYYIILKSDELKKSWKKFREVDFLFN